MHTSVPLTRILGPFAVVTMMVALAHSAFAGGPATIRGTVVDADGEPLAGVSVSALATGGETPQTVATKKKGAFVLRVPDRDATYRVTFSLDGYVTAETTVHPGPENPPPMNVTLARPVERAPPPPTVEDPPPPEDEAVSVSEQRMAAIPSFNEGVDALQAEDPVTALARFRRATELDPDFAEAFRAVAAAAMQTKEYGVAADAAEKYLEFEPDDPDAIGTAYYSELMIGDTDRMAVSARRLAGVNPGLVSNEMVQHSIVLFENNLYAQSRALLEVIVDLQPDLAPAHLQLGLTCNSLGDVECTRAALKRFLEIAPDDDNAAMARSLLEYLN